VEFAANGLVRAKTKTAKLAAINDIFEQMRAGRILGRMVLKLA
jgi:D-arabinose 1-dehydrogenase-like Zn-dependent alcohol dehydrogenase